jgi:hypothetical protein
LHCNSWRSKESVPGQSLPIHSASVPANVRCDPIATKSQTCRARRSGPGRDQLHCSKNWPKWSCTTLRENLWATATKSKSSTRQFGSIRRTRNSTSVGLRRGLTKTSGNSPWTTWSDPNGKGQTGEGWAEASRRATVVEIPAAALPDRAHGATPQMLPRHTRPSRRLRAIRVFCAATV